MNRETLHDIAQFLIGIALITGGFFFLYQLYFSGHSVAQELRESLFQVTGGVIGFIGVVVGFYFGTSLSSARKDSVIANKGTTT